MDPRNVESAYIRLCSPELILVGIYKLCILPLIDQSSKIGEWKPLDLRPDESVSQFNNDIKSIATIPLVSASSVLGLKHDFGASLADIRAA